MHNANILLRAKHPGVVCKPVHFCPVIYGTDISHFVQFGIISPEQNGCYSTLNLVLCVENPPTNPTPPPITPTPSPVTVSPAVGHSNPSTYLPYYNNVQVIGPKPIYITYNSVVGPSVSNNYGISKKNTKGLLSDENKQLGNEEVYSENPEVVTDDGKVEVITDVVANSDDSKRAEVLKQAVDFIRNATLANDKQ